ncbi:hypothetical protein CPB86DRAFT_632902, partial [Serendipita vermifera]
MSNTDTRSYNRFVPVDRFILFDAPDSGPNESFAVRLSLYEGVPVDDGIPDGKKFVVLGSPPIFIEVENAKRYVDPEKCKEDFQRFMEAKKPDLFMPFPMWDDNGKSRDYPFGRWFPDTKLIREEEAWCDGLLKLWKNLWSEAAKPKVGWNNYMRFHQP